MIRMKGSIQERERVRKAREQARRAVSYWNEGWFGAQSSILQAKIRRVIGRDLGEVVKRYPLAIRKDGRKNLWDMTVLEDSLRFDDPATMLGHLANADPSAWLDLLQKEGAEGCSTAEEKAIRIALLRMRVPLCGFSDPASDHWTVGWMLYRDNLLKRKS